MRLSHAIWADMRFQMKQGFYLVYVVITFIYLVILSYLPKEFSPIATPLVVFSDPSVLGLFFIGGIIMLEKNQGILMVMVVSPLRLSEYLLSKVASLSIVSLLAGFAITILSSHENVNWVLLFLSILLTSSLFTLLGIIICAGCQTVNQYFVRMVPYMVLIILPCFSLIGFPYSWLFLPIPSVAALKLMMGCYNNLPIHEIIGLLVYLSGLNYLFFGITLRIFEKKIVYLD